MPSRAILRMLGKLATKLEGARTVLSAGGGREMVLALQGSLCGIDPPTYLGRYIRYSPIQPTYSGACILAQGHLQSKVTVVPALINL